MVKCSIFSLCSVNSHHSFFIKKIDKKKETEKKLSWHQTIISSSDVRKVFLIFNVYVILNQVLLLHSEDGGACWGPWVRAQSSACKDSSATGHNGKVPGWGWMQKMAAGWRRSSCVSLGCVGVSSWRVSLYWGLCLSES